MMKPSKVFWQEPGTDRYCIDNKAGKTINEEQRKKLMALLQDDFDFITVTFEKLPMDLTRHKITFNDK